MMGKKTKAAGLFQHPHSGVPDTEDLDGFLTRISVKVVSDGGGDINSGSAYESEKRRRRNVGKMKFEERVLKKGKKRARLSRT